MAKITRLRKEVAEVYNAYFGFSQSPFENNLDQRFLFLGEDHQEVLAALLYFIQTKKNFAMVCGDVGTGKTMLINSLLERLPETVQTITILNPYVDSLDLLRYLAETLEIKTTGTQNVLDLTDQVKKALLEAKDRNKQVVLIIDEAHHLSDQALEEIRLLSNLETSDQKLLQILLVGQNELSAKLDRPEMRHLRQRININRFLSHLSSAETILYIDHRLQQVGSSFTSVFQDNCKGPIFKITQGVPRLINQLCDNALPIAMNEGLRQVNPQTLKKAMEALQTDRIFTPSPPQSKGRSRLWKYYKISATVGAGLVLGLTLIAVTMPEKFRWISQLTQSIVKPLPEGKAPPQPPKIKEPQTPSIPKGPIAPEETEPPQALPPEKPQSDQKKGQPATTPPAPESKITVAPTKGAGEGTPEVKQEAALAPHGPEGVKEEGKQEEMPSPSTFEQLVARGGESLTRIAAQHYPKDPKLGIAALILENTSVTKVDVIKPGQVLYLPKINFENRTIQLKDNLWYAFYGRYPSPARASQIAYLLTSKGIKFLERDIKSGDGSTIKRIYIGGYSTEEELTQALNSLTTKTQ